MQEKAMPRNLGGGIIGREIVEKESLRGEASRRHLGGIWDYRRLWGSRRLQVTKIDAPLS